MSLDERSLRAIIQDPKYRILLDANHWYDEANNLPLGTTTDATFRLTSGKYQQTFITLWQLFDHHEEFQETLDYFAEMARAILKEKPYDTIVACTATAKYIMDHVHWRIESAEDKIRVVYLGHHPFLSTETKLLQFKDRRVLIITDVNSSGTLVEQLVDAVEQLEGKAIAVLCVAHTDEASIDAQEASGDLPAVAIRGTDEWVEVHSLTRIPIRRYDEPATDSVVPFDIAKSIKIDPATILPVGLRLPNGRKPLIGLADTYAFLESTGAISFDFFKQDRLRYCTAIRCHQLLNGDVGNQIWTNIESEFRKCFTERPDSVLVTLFDADDMAFRNFVVRRLGFEMRKVVVASRELLDSPGSHFLMDPVDKSILAGKPVLLLISQLYEADRLQSLSALLAEQGVTHISVVCLINRLGSDTNEFVSRIRRVLKGIVANSRVDQEDGESHAHFEFTPIMAISDLDNGDLARLHRTVNTLVHYFSEETRSTAFRRLIRQEVDRYFSYKSPTSFVFQCGKSTPLSDLAVFEPEAWPSIQSADAIDDHELTLCWRNESVTARTLDGMLSLLAGYTLETHDFDPLLRQLGRHTDKRVQYRLFCILLVEINYLRMTRRFEVVRDTIMAFAVRLKDARFEFETDSRDSAQGPIDEPKIADYIQRAVDTEANLLFGLSLLSFLDQEFSYGPFIESLLTGDMSDDQWLQLPTNLLLFFSEDRLALGASMLLHLASSKFRSPNSSKLLKERLTASFRKYSDSFCNRSDNRRQLSLKAARMRSEVHEVAADDAIEYADQEANIENLPGDLLLKQVQSNFDFLLGDLGVHYLERRDQVIRYLHREIRLPKRRHNPIRTNLNNVRNLLARLAPNGGAYENSRRQHVLFSRVEKSIIDDAIYTIALLEKIIEAARSFFTFARIKLEDARFYQGSETDEGSLAKLVHDAGETLQGIRKDETVAPVDRRRLGDLRTTIIRRVLSDESVLQRELKRFYVPFLLHLEEAMGHEGEYLKGKGFGDVWERERLKARRDSDLHNLKVIADPLELRELLRNLCRNAEHGFRGLNFQDFSACVTTSYSIVKEKVPPPEHDELEYVVFIMRIDGRPFPEQISDSATVFRHAREIESFGGSLQMTRNEDGKGTLFTLKLITRREVSTDTLSTSEVQSHVDTPKVI